MIYLVCHGQTEFNLEQRIEGSLDSPLTSQGRADTVRLGRHLATLIDGDGDFELIASPQPRAQQSALILREAARLDRPVISDARLAEVGCGSWEKHHFASIRARDPVVEDEPNFLAAWAHHCVDGEGFDDAVERLWGWVRWAGSRKLVVVGHAVSGSILRALYIGEGREAMLTQQLLDPGKIHRLERGWSEAIDPA